MFVDLKGHGHNLSIIDSILFISNALICQLEILSLTEIPICLQLETLYHRKLNETIDFHGINCNKLDLFKSRSKVNLSN